MNGSDNQALLQPFLTEIKTFLSANADEANVVRYSRYFKEGYDAYGVESKLFQAQIKTWCEAYGKRLSQEDCLDLGDMLFSSGKYEEGMVAIHLVADQLASIGPQGFQRLGRWLEEGVRTWAHCDVLCGEVLSSCLRKGLPLEEMSSWRNSPHRFKRRAVSVAMLGLLKEDGERSALLEFIRPMMMDKERVVHQGLGWFLRELWKKEPVLTEKFLLEWKDDAARLIFQYATEKMNQEGKARFRRAKKENQNFSRGRA